MANRRVPDQARNIDNIYYNNPRGFREWELLNDSSVSMGYMQQTGNMDLHNKYISQAQGNEPMLDTKQPSVYMDQILGPYQSDQSQMRMNVMMPQAANQAQMHRSIPAGMGYPNVPPNYLVNQFKKDNITFDSPTFNNYPIPQNPGASNMTRPLNKYMGDRMHPFTSKSEPFYARSDEMPPPLRPMRIERDYISNNTLLKSNLSFKEAASAMLSMDFPMCSQPSQRRRGRSSGPGSKSREPQRGLNKASSETSDLKSADILDYKMKNHSSIALEGQGVDNMHDSAATNWVPLRRNNPMISQQMKQLNLHGSKPGLQQQKLSVVEEINIEKSMMPAIQKNLISSAAIMMETFQQVLANKKKRIRNCLVEDCRQVIGEQPRMDVQYASVDIDGEKHYYLDEIVSTLLPYHLFYYEDIMRDHVPFVNTEASKIDAEFDELNKEVDSVLNGITDSEEIQRAYEFVRSGLEVTNELALSSPNNENTGFRHYTR